MIIDCISDLHGHFPQLEGGDLLIVAGDLTATDSLPEHLSFLRWLSIQEYKKIVFTAGNHDVSLGILKRTRAIFEHPHFPIVRNAATIEYLFDSGTEFEGLKIWGSPWTLRFEGMNPQAMAFTCETEEELAEKWALIPDDVNILVTHSPSYGVLDEVRRLGPFSHERDESVGSESLIKPMIKSGCRLHIFGHIHEAYGKFYNPINGITYVNASHVNERYEPVNKPIRITL